MGAACASSSSLTQRLTKQCNTTESRKELTTVHSPEIAGNKACQKRELNRSHTMIYLKALCIESAHLKPKSVDRC